MVNSTTVQVFGHETKNVDSSFFINAILNFGQECKRKCTTINITVYKTGEDNNQFQFSRRERKAELREKERT